MNNHLTPARRKLNKTPVTLIVGIICRDAIVLAADSQNSYGSLKLPGTNKISKVTFRDKKEILVAESGKKMQPGGLASNEPLAQLSQPLHHYTRTENARNRKYLLHFVAVVYNGNSGIFTDIIIFVSAFSPIEHGVAVS